MEILIIICSVAFISALCHRYVRSYGYASVLTALVSALGGLFITAISRPKEVDFLDIRLVFSGVGLLALVIALLVGIPFALYRLWTKPFPAGHCQSCGCNLAGNESGICPECGTACQVEGLLERLRGVEGGSRVEERQPSSDGEEVPVCWRCLTPFRPPQHYCGSCGETVGQVTPCIPFVNIPFSCSIFGIMWQRVWHDRETGILSKAFFCFMILWFVPVMLLGLPFVALRWWSDYRRPPPGHCQTCGYNLTGNESGVCPECGKPVSSTP